MILTFIRHMKNKILFLIPLSLFLMASILATAQDITVRGIILDEAGEPIIGASIVEKRDGPARGTSSQSDGTFMLQANPQSTLTISYIGFTPQEVPIRNQTNLTIVLVEDTQMLSEVVVVGYGTQKRITLTGAVAAITSEEIITTKSYNVQNMLSGKIAGVKVAQQTSEPGTFTNDFQIRGMGSPLVVIDGVPRDNMVRLDPNEIDAISILKDASAAIYGVRAANGVVLITTKKGESGASFRLNYSGYFGVQTMINQPHPLDAIGFMQIQNEKSLNGGATTLPYPQSSFDPYLNGTLVSTDWEAGTMRKQYPQTQHNINATGGTEKIRYFVNFGYNYNEGAWKSADLYYNRYNLRSNVSAEITKGLRLDMLLNGMMDEKNQPSIFDTWSLFKGFWTQIPLNPLYLDEEHLYPYFAADGLHPDFMTDASKSGYVNTKRRSFQSNMSLEWDIPWVSGLKAKGMYSYDYDMRDNKTFRKAYTLYTETSAGYVASPINTPSRVNREYIGQIRDMFQVSLAYNKSFNNQHNVSALLLYEESNRTADNFYAQREFSMDAVDQLFAGNTTNQVGTMGTGNIYNYANKGLIGRFTYDFSSKYLAEFSFRYDGSSRFGPGHQWGFFPAGSAGWRISEEAFIKDSEALSMISNLKLRASYGMTGDDGGSSYQFVSGYDYPSNGYAFGGQYTNALGMRGLPNLAITWYNATVLDLGLDAELWRGLLGISGDIFRRDRSDLLATRTGTLPGHIGASMPSENLETDATLGYELTLTHRNRIHDLRYNVSAHIDFSRSKWKYREQARAGNSYLNWRNNAKDRWKNVWFVRDVTGRFQSFDEIYAGSIYDGSLGNSRMLPGDLVIDDFNGDGYIDANDVQPVRINTSQPLMGFGLTIGAEYRQFDFSMVFQGVTMKWIQYPEQLSSPLPWNRNGLNIFLDRWHRADEMDPNCTEWVPGHYPSTYADNGRSGFANPTSTFNIEDASYVRLKSLDIGYTLPKPISRKIGMERARIFFSAYDLLTFTGLKYVDPEHTDSDYGYVYPLSQNLNFGLNITF